MSELTELGEQVVHKGLRKQHLVNLEVGIMKKDSQAAEEINCDNDNECSDANPETTRTRNNNSQEAIQKKNRVHKIEHPLGYVASYNCAVDKINGDEKANGKT